jgi:hypothetical protein
MEMKMGLFLILDGAPLSDFDAFLLTLQLVTCQISYALHRLPFITANVNRFISSI